jgi:hypothetical protein
MDTGEWRRSDEPAPVADIDEDDAPRPSRLALARGRWRGYVTQHGRRGAVIGFAVTFVLLLASQWLPWANVVPQSRQTPNFGATDNGVATLATSSSGPFNVGIDDANTAMILTYHLIWVIVLALAGATVFASRRTRQPLFGAAIGAIVVQFVAIIPLLRHPRGLIVNAISEIAAGTGATELVVTRQAGMFCAFAALVVLAGSMVFAVEGDVLPSLAADADAEPMVGTPEPTPGFPAVDIQVDIEVLPDQPVTSDGRNSGPPAIEAVPEPPGQPDVVAFTVEAVEGLPEHPAVPDPPAATDHSAYARPLSNDKYRR